MKILVKNTNEDGVRTVETQATTWGELKSELGVSGDFKAMVRETRATLENDDAILPIGLGKHLTGTRKGQSNGFDCTIAITASKIRAGFSKPVTSTIKEIKTKFNNITEVESFKKRFSKLCNEVLEELGEDVIETPKAKTNKSVVKKSKTGLSQAELDAIEEDLNKF